MGFFDWLFGKRSSSDSAAATPEAIPALEPDTAGRPRPKILSEIGEDSPQIMVDTGNGMATIMDRDTFDYMYGEIDAPDPTQRDLDDLRPKITRVRALSGGLFRGRARGSEVVLETAEPTALDQLRASLDIVEDPSTFTHCGCLGGPTLELFADDQLVATLGLQHGHSIRWAKWKHDAQLVEGRRLTDWLLEHGLEREFLDVLFQNQYEAAGLMPIGFQRGGFSPLTRSEQRLRLAELTRIRGGEFESAFDECQQIVQAEPGLALGYAIRAFFHHQRGDFNSCIDDCGEAIRLGLSQAELYFTRAISRDYTGQIELAYDDCSSALELEPNHKNALNSRGLIGMRLGRVEQASQDLTTAIELAPDWGLPYLNRAQLHQKQGDLSSALDDYDLAIDRLSRPDCQDISQPMLARVYSNRGRIHYEQGNHTKAEADFREATRLDPSLLQQ